MTSIKLTIEMDRNEDSTYTVAFSQKGEKYFDGISASDPVHVVQEVGEYVTAYLLQRVEGIARTPISQFD